MKKTWFVEYVRRRHGVLQIVSSVHGVDWKKSSGTWQSLGRRSPFDVKFNGRHDERTVAMARVYAIET